MCLPPLPGSLSRSVSRLPVPLFFFCQQGTTQTALCWCFSCTGVFAVYWLLSWIIFCLFYCFMLSSLLAFGHRHRSISLFHTLVYFSCCRVKMECCSPWGSYLNNCFAHPFCMSTFRPNVSLRVILLLCSASCCFAYGACVAFARPFLIKTTQHHHQQQQKPQQRWQQPSQPGIEEETMLYREIATLDDEVC